MSASQTVVVLGASTDPTRYAHRAQRMLVQHGHRVIPVARSPGLVLGEQARASLEDIDEPVDTLTVYLRPELSQPLVESILRLRPGRVIFNPGAENPRLARELAESGIPTEEACTLVLLRTGQF